MGSAIRERRDKRLSVFPDEAGGVGGNTISMLCDAALKIGDIVNFTAAGHVGKTATAASSVKFAGVVVGGGSAFGADTAIFGSDAVGMNATTAAEQVVQIQIDGIAYVVADAAVAAVVPVTSSAIVAGRISITGATAGQIVGTTIDAGAGAASVLRMKIAHR